MLWEGVVGNGVKEALVVGVVEVEPDDVMIAVCMILSKSKEKVHGRGIKMITKEMKTFFNSKREKERRQREN